MKHRIILILSLLTLEFLPSLAEDNYYGVALLSHQGKQTAYAADNVQAAVDDAVEGDTIYFARGNYKDFILNKRVFLHGGVASSLYFHLKLPDNSSIDTSMFKGNWFNIWISCNLKNITIEDLNGRIHVNQGYHVGTIVISRCEISDIMYDWFNVDKLQVNNSYLDGGFHEGSSSVTESEFVNCNIYSGTFSNSKSTFENCILYCNNGDGFTLDNCSLTNCLYDPEKFHFVESITPVNCYAMSQDAWDDSKENLEAQGFLGTDNTIVGYYGSTHPFIGLLRDIPIINNVGFKMEGKTIIGNWKVNPKR